jgi:hypothetical protein
MTATIVVALLGVASTVGAVLVTGWFGRKQADAQAELITATAHEKIYGAYGVLLDELRTDNEATRQQVLGANDRARRAEERADAAEEMAYQANARMRNMEQLLVELRPFLEGVAGSETFVAQIDRLTSRAPRN